MPRNTRSLRFTSLRRAAVFCVLLAAVLVFSAVNVRAQNNACTTTQCFTASQRQQTKALLQLLASNIAATNINIWIGDDFCKWKKVFCLPHGLSVQFIDVDASGTLPELTSNIQVADVMINYMSFISSKGIGGTLPETWSRLVNLRQVDVSGTSVTGTIPSSWAALPSFELLDVSRTTVGGTLPSSWRALSTLKHVSVRQSSVTGTLPVEWKSLTNMEWFEATSTALSGTLPPEYAAWSKLTFFTVYGTGIGGTIPDTWGCMTSLQQASFEQSKVTGCLPYEWLCDRKLTASGVGLTSTACPAADQVCAAPRGPVSFTCPTTTTLPPVNSPGNAAATRLSVWAVAAVAGLQLAGWWLSL